MAKAVEKVGETDGFQAAKGTVRQRQDIVKATNTVNLFKVLRDCD